MLTFDDVIKKKLEDPHFRNGWKLLEIQEKLSEAKNRSNISLSALSEETGLGERAVRQIFSDISKANVETLQEVALSLGYELELELKVIGDSPLK